ncbi:MAG: ribosome maturation factor RimP [Desulfomonilaceae bacterium]|nr:ribosome maturation factor RimP [Desulfomonilaceae bacterium]
MDREFITSLWDIIEPVLEPDGIELVDLEYKPEGGKWVLRLYIDTSDGVTLDLCAQVSRQVGALLDMEDPIEHPYNLEVSSPGVNRVIRKEKDFRLFSGSPVRIKTRRKLQGRRNFSGTLLGVENSMIIVDVEGTRVEINPEDVERARLDLPAGGFFRQDLRRGTVRTGV